MTKLELMICEAENAGEIDLDTRNRLLSVLLTEGAKTGIVRGNNTNKQVDASFESERKSVAKRMQNDLFMYLKKYVSKKEFKDKYKDFLHLINIKKDDFSCFHTSVEITEWQDGIDSDALLEWENEHEDEIKGLDDDTVLKMNPHTKNEWYDELLNEGCRYLETKYKDEMKKYRIGVNYGDGDEGHIYIIDEEKE